MKRLFNIATEEAASKGNVLLLEISHYHACIATADAAGKKVTSLHFYEHTEPFTRDNLQQLFNNVPRPTNGFERIVVGSAFAGAELVPQALMSKEDMHSTLQPTAEGAVKHDAINEKEMVVVYTLPPILHTALQALPGVETMHVYTPDIKEVAERVAENEIRIYFTSKEFRVVVHRGPQLLLAQLYKYASPMDVVYYLLMISSQYGLPQDTTALVLGGLISEDSALYQKIVQYFTDVSFAKETGISMPQHDYHPHFFSSIINLATCVL